MAESWKGAIRLGFSLPPGATHTHANVTTPPTPRPKEMLVLATKIFVTRQLDKLCEDDAPMRGESRKY